MAHNTPRFFRKISVLLFLGCTVFFTGCPDRVPSGDSSQSEKTAKPATLVLSKEHPPVILLVPNALVTEHYAARELAHYLGAILQQEVPILQSSESVPNGAVPVYVGYHPENARFAPEEMNAEASLFSVTDRAIHIVGGRSKEKNPLDPELLHHDRGTLYAVYDFLESLGVRWYRPEPWGEHVPKHDILTLEIGEHRSQPAFQYRYGINLYQTFTPFESQAKDAQELEAIKAERAMAQTWATRNRQNTNIWSEPKMGGYYRIDFAHAYRYLVPHQKYFATHPEYFALVNGKRSSDPNAQLCLSNPEVEDLVFKHIVQSFERNPDLDIASLDPNDYGIWCECENCRAMDDPDLHAAHASSDTGAQLAGVSMSNRVVTFNNRIAKRLQAVLPDKKVGWYAYYLHTEVPTKVDHLEPNTAVMTVAFAGSFSDYSRGLYDPKSKQNARFLKILQGYHRLAEKSGSPLLAHDYWSFYTWPGPLPVLHSMQDKLRAYHHDFNITGIYNETHPCWGPQGMILYFYTWLLRNPEGDLDAEKEYYYRSFYGPAADAMREYHETLENAAWGGSYFGSGGSEIEPLFTNQLLATLEPMIRKAEEQVAGDPILEKRVQSVAAGWEYARKVRNFYDAIEASDRETASKELEALHDYFYAFEDGSVFDSRASERGNWDKIFNKYRKLLDRDGKLGVLFEQPQVVQNHADNWLFQTDPKRQGRLFGWQKVSFADQNWTKLKAGMPWQSQGISEFQGIAWYRKTFTTPKVASGKRLILYFGAVDGDATIYLNGERLGEHRLHPQTGAGYDEPFFFDVTDTLPPGTPAVLAIQIEKNKFVGGLTAPVSLIEVQSIRPPE